jgi:hypothetical protein
VFEGRSIGGWWFSAASVVEVAVLVGVIQLHDLYIVLDNRESISSGFLPRDVDSLVVVFSSNLGVNRPEVDRGIRSFSSCDNKNLRFRTDSVYVSSSGLVSVAFVGDSIILSPGSG